MDDADPNDFTWTARRFNDRKVKRRGKGKSKGKGKRRGFRGRRFLRARRGRSHQVEHEPARHE